ncbi:hypothetical protein CA223_06720 [Sphingomonas koreensis]|uniref:Uncharacterized protein n=1 Tax=Sphingomonas koreensis TaxID=93064 RepID=A0A1L6J849_9SPHN|nr:hypothetical protein [Sphingomonas koreensis]APR52007.1 hypothetical protein BRX40_05760 [Sphingomonas koreensis]RSU22811.1 hypothetical protein CA224_05380 [Sphingomonas koreensis]RSU30715.1 hypothetical protein CA222_01165 [Sphingomonas koreensis]RSU31810.1 hypothetical protein CA225_00245 [Sphingomonas koreensis]RSU39269.1 hypothetical protein BRX39_01285 [Sphingomonas koreensis]
MAKIEGQVSVADIMEALTKAGIVSQVAHDRIVPLHGDRLLDLNALVEDSELVAHAATDTLLEQLDTRGELAPEVNPHNIAEGIGYARSGQPWLAEAMFAREMPDTDMTPISAALRAPVPA